MILLQTQSMAAAVPLTTAPPVNPRQSVIRVQVILLLVVREAPQKADTGRRSEINHCRHPTPQKINIRKNRSHPMIEKRAVDPRREVALITVKVDDPVFEPYEEYNSSMSQHRVKECIELKHRLTHLLVIFFERYSNRPNRN